MAITMRIGKESEFDPNKMVPGEWAVSTDTRYVRMCFAPGIVMRMATYESFEADMAQIRTILTECKSIQSAIQRIQSEVNAKASITIEYANAAAESAEKAAESEAKAKMYAENAEAVTGIKIATQTEAGLMRGGENYIDESGELQLTKRTDSPTLYNSYAGGIKLNGLGGVSVQESTTGAQLFDASTLSANNNASLDVANNGYTITAIGGTSQGYTSSDTTAFDVELFRGKTVYLKADSITTQQSGAGARAQLRYLDASGNYVYNRIAPDSLSIQIKIPEDVAEITLGVYTNNTGTTLTTNNTVTVKGLMLSFEQALPWEPYTGNAPSPSPEYPQVIKPVEGKNQLDCRGLVETESNGGTFTPVYDENGNLLYVEVNGTFSADSVIILNSNFILTPEKQYTFTCEGVVSGITFNIWYVGDTTTFPYNFKWVRTDVNCGLSIKIKAGTYNNVIFYPMIRPASIADDTYVPYGLLRFWGHGKNLWRNYALEVGSFNSTNGQPSASLERLRNVNFISINKGDWVISNSSDNQVIMYVYDSNGTFISNESVIEWKNTPFSFNLSENRKVKFAFRKSDNSVVNIGDVTDIQLEEGTEATPYKPYTEQSHTLSDPIKLNGVGTAQDKFVRKDGVWKIERNVGTTDLTGATWAKNSEYQYYTNKDSDKYLETSNVLCDRLIGGKGNNHVYINANSNIRIGIVTEEDTVEAVAEALNGAILYAPLAEPTYEDLPTADQIALDSLVSYNGITYLYCDSEVQPTWDLEYGTSRVGGYTLEAWNIAMSEKILNEARYNEIVAAMLVMNQE